MSRVNRFDYAVLVAAIVIILASILVAMFYNPPVANGEELMGNRGGCGQRVSYPGKIVAVGRNQVTVEVALLNYARYNVHTHRRFSMRSDVTFGGCIALDSRGKEIIAAPFEVSR